MLTDHLQLAGFVKASAPNAKGALTFITERAIPWVAEHWGPRAAKMTELAPSKLLFRAGVGAAAGLGASEIENQTYLSDMDPKLKWFNNALGTGMGTLLPFSPLTVGIGAFGKGMALKATDIGLKGSKAVQSLADSTKSMSTSTSEVAASQAALAAAQQRALSEAARLREVDLATANTQLSTAKTQAASASSPWRNAMLGVGAGGLAALGSYGVYKAIADMRAAHEEERKQRAGRMLVTLPGEGGSQTVVDLRGDTLPASYQQQMISDVKRRLRTGMKNRKTLRTGYETP